MAPRATKNSRMDAAINAMRPLGYSEKSVRETAEEFLKDYGEYGWHIFENDSYRILLERILDKQTNGMQEEREKEKLEAKEALDLEVERLKKMYMEIQEKMGAIAEKLKEKEKENELDDMNAMNGTLTIVQRKTNDELQEARKELINGLRQVTTKANIRVKKMGELDTKPFLIATERKRTAVELCSLCSLWEDHLKDPSWHPFKIVMDREENAKEVIDEEEKLKNLKDKYGDEVYDAVRTALKEMNEYNPSGRYVLLGDSKAMKGMRKRREHQSIKFLPNDLLMEVFVKVASASLFDLFKLKLSCKDFCGLVEDDYIFQHVSLKELPLVWCTSDGVLSFLKRCKESGNPDALFREGIYEYFSSKNPKLGLEFLKKASKKEHIEASYIYGIILICSGGPLKQQGFRLLSSLITSKLSDSRIKECRRRVKNCIRSMWINNNMVKDQESYCPTETCCNYGRTPNSLTAKGAQWLSNDYIENEDDKFICCEFCRCHHEVHLFCNMLQGK